MEIDKEYSIGKYVGGYEGTVGGGALGYGVGRLTGNLAKRSADKKHKADKVKFETAKRRFLDEKKKFYASLPPQAAAFLRKSNKLASEGHISDHLRYREKFKKLASPSHLAKEKELVRLQSIAYDLEFKMQKSDGVGEGKKATHALLGTAIGAVAGGIGGSLAKRSYKRNQGTPSNKEFSEEDLLDYYTDLVLDQYTAIVPEIMGTGSHSRPKRLQSVIQKGQKIEDKKKESLEVASRRLKKLRDRQVASNQAKFAGAGALVGGGLGFAVSHLTTKKLQGRIKYLESKDRLTAGEVYKLRAYKKELNLKRAGSTLAGSAIGAGAGYLTGSMKKTSAGKAYDKYNKMPSDEAQIVK